MSVMDLQRLSITLGTLTDKANHLRGNVVPAVAIDARHQAVLALDHVSLEDLRALLAEVRAQTPVEAGVVPSTESPRGVTSPATPAGSGVRLPASVRAAWR